MGGNARRLRERDLARGLRSGPRAGLRKPPFILAVEKANADHRLLDRSARIRVSVAASGEVAERLKAAVC